MIQYPSPIFSDNKKITLLFILVSAVTNMHPKNKFHNITSTYSEDSTSNNNSAIKIAITYIKIQIKHTLISVAVSSSASFSISIIALTKKKAEIYCQRPTL